MSNISFNHMSFIRNQNSTISNSAGYDSTAINPENIVRYTGYAVGATVVVGSIGVMTVVAPAQIALAAGVTAGCTIAANRMRNGKSPIPGMGSSDSSDTVNTQPVSDIPASA